MRKCFLSCGLLLSCIQFFAQPASDSLLYPRVGQPCPDFVLQNIRHYSKSHANLRDFKGKWLMLVFWNKRCAACMANFPRESELQQKLGDKVQVMSVAIKDKEGEIEPMFERYRKAENLLMPCAFDSALANQWDIYVGPQTILIDPDGIVRGKPSVVTIEMMEGFLSGNPPRMSFDPYSAYEFEKDPRTPFEPEKPMLVNGNGGVDSNFLYRSLISEFNCETQRYGGDRSIKDGIHKGRFQVLGVPVMLLYNLAWYGAIYPTAEYVSKPVVEVKNDSLFRVRLSGCEGHYCYSLSLPPDRATPERVMHIMKQDLENYFGYTASIEERKFPSLKLVALDKAKTKLKTKGGAPKDSTLFKAGYRILRNQPIQKLVDILEGAFNMKVADATGIKGNIDIEMNCLFLNKDDVKRALKENGLELLPGDGEIKKVLVIRDEKTSAN